jgi:hypothetical protein
MYLQTGLDSLSLLYTNSVAQDKTKRGDACETERISQASPPLYRIALLRQSLFRRRVDAIDAPIVNDYHTFTEREELRQARLAF